MFDKVQKKQDAAVQAEAEKRAKVLDELIVKIIALLCEADIIVNDAEVLFNEISNRFRNVYLTRKVAEFNVKPEEPKK